MTSTSCVEVEACRVTVSLDVMVTSGPSFVSSSDRIESTLKQAFNIVYYIKNVIDIVIFQDLVLVKNN